jgi:hypothetical protein
MDLASSGQYSVAEYFNKVTKSQVVETEKNVLTRSATVRL